MRHSLRLVCKFRWLPRSIMERHQEPLMKATLTSCLLLFITLAAAAQTPPVVNAQANMVYVSAEGKYESAPDTAMVQFMISAQEELAKDAYSRASQEAEQ